MSIHQILIHPPTHELLFPHLGAGGCLFCQKLVFLVGKGAVGLTPGRPGLVDLYFRPGRPGHQHVRGGGGGNLRKYEEIPPIPALGHLQKSRNVFF